MQDQSMYAQIKPQFTEQEQLKCPRCGSFNTKFCYYNNYNLSQPRHFCKNCRRYWTKGGALRNIPVGGGTRKNTKRSSNPKRPSSSASAATTSPSLPTPLPSSSSFDQDRRVLDIGGSFSSLLESNAEYGNLLLEALSPPSGPTVSVHLGGLTNQYPNSHSESDLIRSVDTQQQLKLHSSNNSESPFGVEGNLDSSCWNGGNEWPDLSMYTPAGSSFTK